MAFKAVQVIEIDVADDGQRIDNYLFRLLKGVPKSRVYRLIRKGEVRVNGGRAKPDRRLRAGDNLRVPPVRQGDQSEATAPSHTLIENVSNSIIYEDNEMLVLNKPSGIAVHGGSGVNAGVIEALRHLKTDCKRLELVHRLDRGTSGCLMVAKKRSALVRLQAALRDKIGIEKTYWAVVRGEWPAARQEITLPLARRTLEGGDRVSRVASDGKPSLTRFQVLQAGRCFTWLEARPVTGRTHQIRVHCATSGHPVVGDDKYGDDANGRRDAGRLMLHAVRLVMPDAEGRPVTIEAPPDAQFETLRNQYLSNS